MDDNPYLSDGSKQVQKPLHLCPPLMLLLHSENTWANSCPVPVLLSTSTGTQLNHYCSSRLSLQSESLGDQYTGFGDNSRSGEPEQKQADCADGGCQSQQWGGQELDRGCLMVTHLSSQA